MTRFSTCALTLATCAALASLVATCVCLVALQGLQAAHKPLPPGCSRAYKPMQSSKGPVLIETLACLAPAKEA